MGDLALWIRFAVVIVAPIVFATYRGRLYLMEDPYRVPVWTALLVSAGAGLLAKYGFLLKSIHNDTALVLTVPSMQAGVFVLLNLIFKLLAGRYPLALDEARFGRRSDGKRHVSDLTFWLPTCFIVIFVGIIVCAHFGIELPSRYRSHA